MPSGPTGPSGGGDEAAPSGPLAGLRVVELASELGAHAGKLLADLGAEVLLVEPPGGHATRTRPPFADDVVDPERSLWFWHYNTSKLGISLDLAEPGDVAALVALVGHADVVLEAEPVGRLVGLGIDQAVLRERFPGLVWVSITSHGLGDPRSAEPWTDLTLMAEGGMVWNCGYDDHSLPPVRGDGYQALHTTSIWAAICALVAVRARAATGEGQLVDVSASAACNVTTEQGSHFWLVGEKLVHRQTARHASPRPTEPVVHLDRDGREIHTGFPPTRAEDLARLVAWVDDLDLRDELPTLVLLEMAIEAGGIDLTHLDEDALVQETYRTVREAVRAIAGRLTAREFFVDGQLRGLAVGVVAAPEEVMVDEHLVARGFPVEVRHPELGRTFTYPGPPVRFTGTPARIRRPAPRVGEHQELATERWSEHRGAR